MGAAAMYTKFHETLHEDGFSDQQPERDLGITQGVVNAQGSNSITFKLMQVCGQ